MVRYGRTLREIQEVVAKSGHSSDEFAPYSLRVGRPIRLAAGRRTSERVIQRKGRWGSDAYKIYTRNNLEYSRRVSRELAVANVGKERQPEKEQFRVGTN